MLHHQTYGGDLLVASEFKFRVSLVLSFPASKMHNYLPCAGLT